MDTDDDFAEALVRQTTELLGKALVNVKSDIASDRQKLRSLCKDFNELKTQNEVLTGKIKVLEETGFAQSQTIVCLQNRVKLLEEAKCSCNVTDQLTRAFTAAAAAINLPDESLSTPSYTTDTAPTDTVSTSINTTTVTESTPTSSFSGLKRKESPNLSPMDFYTASKIAKRKDTQKTKCITDLELLNENTRESLREYYVENPKAKSDLLNKLQRAFVKYQANRILINRESISMHVAKRIIQEGISEQIWDKKFQPSDTESFEKYLLNRLKNERRALKNLAALHSQEKVLQECMSAASRNLDSTTDSFPDTEQFSGDWGVSQMS